VAGVERITMIYFRVAGDREEQAPRGGQNGPPALAVMSERCQRVSGV